MTEYAWFDAGNGRQVYRRIVEPSRSRSSLPCPMLITDSIEPTQSMADGQTYTSKAALRRTYRADGNPQGKEYVEVGNDQTPREQKSGVVKRDQQAIRNTAERAIAAVNRGEVSENVRNIV